MAHKNEQKQRTLITNAKVINFQILSLNIIWVFLVIGCRLSPICRLSPQFAFGAILRSTHNAHNVEQGYRKVLCDFRQNASVMPFNTVNPIVLFWHTLYMWSFGNHIYSMCTQQRISSLILLEHMLLLPICNWFFVDLDWWLMPFYTDGLCAHIFSDSHGEW